MSGRAPIVTSIVVDFDGTICEQDVSEELLQAFAPASWWDIDLEFRRGMDAPTLLIPEMTVGAA